MIVAGYTVPAEVEARLVERMRARAFATYHLTQLGESLELPTLVASKLADKLIERERKARHLNYHVGRGLRPALWSWRHPTASPAGREG